MNGTLHVLKSLNESQILAMASESVACAPTRSFVRDWTLESIEGELMGVVVSPEEHEREKRLDQGGKLFRELSCSRCHVADAGGKTLGPQLTAIREKLKSDQISRHDLVQSLVTPSAKIDDLHRTTTVIDGNGRVISGIVVDRSVETLTLAVNPESESRTVTIPNADVEELHKSNVSLMPQGLLNTLEAAEILSLIEFLESTRSPVDDSAESDRSGVDRRP
jgi:hypothetical protein